MKAYSLLDLVPVNADATPADAFANACDLARVAEQSGYCRYWIAEHHNMPGIASAATAVVIGHVAAATETIRVGAGGIMLPNHSPLVIAEQFGTLASLYPDRIDLGLGRAPGSDGMTARALRRDHVQSAERFPQDVIELQNLFAEPAPDATIQAVPGGGLDVPLWILGSSLFGARLAAALGLPFAFASHFAPEMLLQALDIYRREFRPSASLAQPHVMIGVNLFTADTTEEAQFLFSSLCIQFTNLFRGRPGKLQPPTAAIDDYWSPAERAGVERALHYAVVGDRETCRQRLQEIIELTAADEVMLTGQIFDHTARLKSFETGAAIMSEIINEQTESALTAITSP